MYPRGAGLCCPHRRWRSGTMCHRVETDKAWFPHNGSVIGRQRDQVRHNAARKPGLVHLGADECPTQPLENLPCSTQH